MSTLSPSSNAQAFSHAVVCVEALDASTAPNYLQFVPRIILSKKQNRFN